MHVRLSSRTVRATPSGRFREASPAKLSATCKRQMSESLSAETRNGLTCILRVVAKIKLVRDLSIFASELTKQGTSVCLKDHKRSVHLAIHEYEVRSESLVSLGHRACAKAVSSQAYHLVTASRSLPRIQTISIK